MSKQSTPSEKEISPEPRFQQTVDINTESQLKKSLDNIEKKINESGASSQLLIQKAEILLRKRKIRQARQILNELSNNENDPETLVSAKKLLALSNKIKGETSARLSQELLEKLQKIAEIHGFQLPEFSIIEKQNIKHIKLRVYKQLRSCIKSTPIACQSIIDTLLDYFPSDLAILLLKGEALDTLGQRDEAIQIWKEMVDSEHNNIATKARELITNSILNKSISIDQNKNYRSVILLFIQEHLKHNLCPILSENARDILRQAELSHEDSFNPELRNHQLQLEFHTLVIECLEQQYRDRGGLTATTPTQKPDAIRETPPKVG